MGKKIDNIINRIAEMHRKDILNGARHYLEVNIGEQADTLGYTELKKKFGHLNAIVPLKNPKKGMKVRIDGRTFENYAQYASGIAVPKAVARAAGLPYNTFRPNNSMILNFA